MIREASSRVVFFGLLAAVVVAVSAAATTPVFGAPYEPNDSILEATGPLANGQSYSAGLETQSDRDFFYFYVISPQGSKVTLTATNFGGGTQASNIDMAIVDSTETPIRASAYIGKDEVRALSVTLQPQKYLVEVAPGEGFGDEYSLSVEGGGALGAYAQIAARCSYATAAVERGKRICQGRTRSYSGRPPGCAAPATKVTWRAKRPAPTTGRSGPWQSRGEPQWPRRGSPACPGARSRSSPPLTLCEANP